MNVNCPHCFKKTLKTSKLKTESYSTVKCQNCDFTYSHLKSRKVARETVLNLHIFAFLEKNDLALDCGCKHLEMLDKTGLSEKSLNSYLTTLCRKKYLVDRVIAKVNRAFDFEIPKSRYFIYYINNEGKEYFTYLKKIL